MPPTNSPLPISARQRRARVGHRHHLAVGSRGTAADLAGDLVALHATDPASVYLSIAARAPSLNPDDIVASLYEERTLIRMLGMRRTMFVVPTTMAPVVQHSSSDAVAARVRRALVKELAGVVPEPDAWLDDLADSVVATLQELGGASALTLSRLDPRLRTKIGVADDKPYNGPVSINSRVLNLISAQGRIVRGRPSGSWSGSQYEWAPVQTWIPDGLPRLDPAEAQITLVERYLARFGPATLSDIVWWSGWNQRDTRRALAGIATTAVDLDGEPAFVLEADTDPVDEPEPWIALLPALDPTPMGWFGRDWYITADQRRQLFDRTGNIGPTVWCNGRVVGGWAQRADGEIGWRLLEDIGRDLTAAVGVEAARLNAWIGQVRVIPRFRTPLDRELCR
jgi:hypothetical protein